jgi:hypothetical protein
MVKGKSYKEDQSGNMIRTLWIILVAVLLQDTVTGNSQSRITLYMLVVVVCFSCAKSLLPLKQKAYRENKHVVHNEDAKVV